MNRIGAVIIAHNSAREIGLCLDSLPAGLEIVVVDNASQDGTRAEVSRRGVPLIANPGTVDSPPPQTRGSAISLVGACCC